MEHMDVIMSDSEEGSETIDELRVKIARLKEELAQASREKVQAAEYGLAVLDEKQHLKQQYEEMEILFETAKQELQMAKEVNFSFCTIPSLSDGKIVTSFSTQNSQFNVRLSTVSTVSMLRQSFLTVTLLYPL